MAMATEGGNSVYDQELCNTLAGSSAREFILNAVKYILESGGGCAKRGELTDAVYRLATMCGVTENRRSVRQMVADAIEKLEARHAGISVCLPSADPAAYFLYMLTQIELAKSAADFCERSRRCVKAAIAAGMAKYLWYCGINIPREPLISQRRLSGCGSETYLCVESVSDILAYIDSQQKVHPCEKFVIPSTAETDFFRELLNHFKSANKPIQRAVEIVRHHLIDERAFWEIYETYKAERQQSDNA
jgi:hypothetical protein